jgi:hypothetical protein
VKRFPPVGEDHLRRYATDGGGDRAGMAIFHGFVFAPEKMAAQGQSAGRPSRCRPQKSVAAELDFLQPRAQNPARERCCPLTLSLAK